MSVGILARGPVGRRPRVWADVSTAAVHATGSAITCEPWTGMVETPTAIGLVAVSHGTNSPQGQAAVSALVRAVASRRPDLNVVESFVDVQQPALATSLAGLAGRTRVVPLLLSAGYHVHVDLAEAAAARPGTTVSGALGPDQRLVQVLARRLREAGTRPGDHVVLGCAGSNDQRAIADCEATAASLAAWLGQPVSTGYISAANPELKQAVESARGNLAEARAQHGSHGADADGRVVVATYLLAPGHFSSLARECGADVVTEPLLTAGQEPPAEIVALVLDRFGDGR
ncbi:sirohydrochlorin chelatase [Arthrobacter sp.]|uniref:sirohydrochlorin chelatase n=1 Tax=Arthrobacter sp. TaxID=1667 RepID=UPI003A9377C4